MPAQELETKLLILQASPYCNIGCTYCYLPDRDQRDQMSISTLRSAVRAVEDAGLNRGHLVAVWHAGEPLALPLGYFREAFAAVREEQRAAPIALGIQTNAITVTDEHCRLFCDFDVGVGVSLDGPIALHDRHRLTRAGGGTHTLTVRGLRRLQAAGLKPYALAVVTRETVARPAAEFFRFFRELDVTKICLNFEEIEGVNRSSSLDGTAADDQLRRWLGDLYDAAIVDPTCWIREFGETMQAARSIGPGSSTLTRPFAIISVDWRGNFSTFSPELLSMRAPDGKDFIFGNVRDGALTAALEGAKLRAVHAEITAGIDACRASCPYFHGCAGGTPSNKLAELGTFAGTETLACRTRTQAVQDVVFAKYEAELAAGAFPATHAGRRI